MTAASSSSSSRSERGFGIGLGILVLICLVSFVQISRYAARTAHRQKLDGVAAGFQQLEVRLREAEAQHAGFLASGEEDFVRDYNRSLQSFEAGGQELRARLADPEVAGLAVGPLFEATQRRVQLMNEAMQLRAEGRVAESRRLSAGTDARRAAEALNLEFRALERRIGAALRAGDASFADSARALQVLIIGGTLLGLALVLWNRRQNLRQRENLKQISKILEEGRTELLRANEEARASAQAKSDFLANISHEVRTPMNAIAGLSQILKRSGLNDEQLKLVDGIQKSTQGLLDVINPVLDVSKIEHEGVALDAREGVDLRRLIEESAGVMRGQAAVKGLELRVRLPEEIGFFRMDAGRLRQVFLNLLGNAIKFTERGGVEFALEIPVVRESEKALRFTVTDTGIGIPEEARGRLFQSFSQTDTSISRRFGGTGLGLAISKSIVEAMGGRIGFESREGEGTQFWVEVVLPTSLPAVPGVGVSSAPPTPVAMTKPSGPPRASARARALVIEDNPMNQFVLENFLRELGVESESCAGGPEALALLKKDGHFDVFFVDVQMPGMDGFQVTAELRADPRFAKHPIIACTAHAMQGYREKCLAAGMTDYLVKPIESEALAEILTRVLKSTGTPLPVAGRPSVPPPAVAESEPVGSVGPSVLSPDAAAPAPTGTEGPMILPATAPEAAGPMVPQLPPVTPSINEKRWAKLQSGPEGREMIAIFLETTPPRCAELGRTVEAGAWAEAEDHAHFLKSSASSMAFDRWTEQLTALEDACSRAAADEARRLWAEAEIEYRDLCAWLGPDAGRRSA